MEMEHCSSFEKDYEKGYLFFSANRNELQNIEITLNRILGLMPLDKESIRYVLISSKSVRVFYFIVFNEIFMKLNKYLR